MQEKSLRSVAEDIAKTSVDAVILALWDSGVTAYIVVLAWELERQGLPTVTLFAGQCIHLAATMSSVVMPGLPLNQLSIQRHSAPTDIAAKWAGSEEKSLTVLLPLQNSCASCVNKNSSQGAVRSKLMLRENSTSDHHNASCYRRRRSRQCLSIPLTMP
jgi:hypothetical protein